MALKGLLKLPDRRDDSLMLAVTAIRRKKGKEIDFAAIQDKLNSVASAEAEVYKELLQMKLA